MKKVTVIIPTTGAETLSQCLNSVLEQTYKNTTAYVVIDGKQYWDKASNLIYVKSPNALQNNCSILKLPENVGGNNYYGHRVYASVPHLVNSDYVLFLDQDNWLDKDHVESMVDLIESKNLHWAYSLRKIMDVNGEFVCLDNSESLGKWNPYVDYNHVDTSCYCIPTNIAIQICNVWHGQWGRDRVFYNAISCYFENYECTGKHTVNYRLGGNTGSVQKEFFLNGNKMVAEIYNGEYPWSVNND